MNDFSPKRQAETELFTVDFVSRLASGVTLLTATWSNSSASDPSASSMLQGGATISGTKVSQLIRGGIVGVIYTPLCTVTTRDGQTLILPDPGTGRLPVVA